MESRPGGDLLSPVHRFVHIDLSHDKALVEFTRECVQFVCACMNERANGTIHFGIKSTDCNPFPSGGEVVGMALVKDFEVYGGFITKALQNCFAQDQSESVLQCVRPLQFVEVIPQESSPLYVIEIDVIAAYRWCEERAFFARLPISKGTYENMTLFRIVDGIPRALQLQELNSFMENKTKLADERKAQELKARNCQGLSPWQSEHLNKKFLRLFCGGEENFYGDHYRILVINAPDDTMTEEWMEDNIQFLCDLEWKAVFDFDHEARICKFFQKREELVNITMSEEFNCNSSFNRGEPDRFRSLCDDLSSSVVPSWVFVNGYSENSKEERLPPVQWKRKKSDGFKEAVRFFESQIPPGRATIMFCLFSNDTDVILEAAEEFLTCFPENWFCVTKAKSIGKPWVAELVRRNWIEPQEDRLVVGMPWKHINETLARIQAPKHRAVCELPTSTGAMVVLKPSVMNDLSDIEVLGCYECDAQHATLDKAGRENKQKEEENTFFRGESPSWWNFWFPNQVCERDIHNELKNYVQRALQSPCEDDIIDRVYIYHDIGSGGTTSARHVLWDLRRHHRVGILRNSSDHRTGEQIKRLADQILKLYQYEDPQPKPLLLLMDNPDEETGCLLMLELEDIAKKMKRHGDAQRHDGQSQVVCVFLVCVRQTKIKHDGKQHGNKSDMKYVSLKHELSEREKIWFQEKAKALDSQFDPQDSRSVNPRLLISFNILKENFSETFIRRMVKDLVAGIQDCKERQLLKYVSLINAFDLDCRPLPSSAFDGIMIQMPYSPGQRMGRKAVMNRWEVRLSAPFRILMNESTKPAMGYIHTLRITNPLLSLHILSELQTVGDNKELVSEMALELFHCKDMFAVSSITRNELLNIVKDILKKRRRLPNRLPEHEFAPLILHVVKKESPDKAVLVLEEGYKLTNDAFVAQQLARLFIRYKNWERAFEYAKYATELVSDNSFLWDTYGRIYEGQLMTELENDQDDSTKFSTQEFIRIADLGLAGLNIFRKVHTLNENEKLPNSAGYFGELRMITTLLDCLMKIGAFHSVDKMRQFLVVEDNVPEELRELEDVDGMNYVQALKKLKSNVDRVLNHIEDEKLQLRNDMKLPRFAPDNLFKLKTKLNNYFGEDKDEPPEDMPLNQQCYYRRRRIFSLASYNMKSIFDLRLQKGGRQTLEQIQGIISVNVNSEHVRANDYVILISVNLALASIDPEFCCKVNFADMVAWSKKLYETRELLNPIYLEPYLFLTMFNWPRNSIDKAMTAKALEMALRQWKDAYNQKYPRQCDDGKPYRKKDATLFFLANGSGMESIYTMFEDHRTMRANEARSSPYWRQPDTIQKLQRFRGTLSSGGKEVEIRVSKVTIPTSFPIRERSMWMKEVYFVVGFSWVGPKAFDVSLDDPSQKLSEAAGM